MEKMERLVVDGYGSYIGVDHDQIIVKRQGKILYRGLPEKLRQVIISGTGSITINALEKLAEYGVDIILINWKGEIKARLSPPMLRTVATRREQYYAYQDKRSVKLSKEFIKAKIKNQVSVLGTLAKKRKAADPETAEQAYKAQEEISKNAGKIENVNGKNCNEIRGSLMGLEGRAATTYWNTLTKIMPKEYKFPTRTGRYAKDPVNSMLNYGYALLEGEVWRAVHYAGLDPYAGFLHVDRPGRPSMVLDLMEEFRQQLVDKPIIKLTTKRQIDPQSFETKEGLCKMKKETREILLNEILNRFESYVRTEDEKIRWCTLILKQAQNIAKYLRKETTTYRGFYLRW